MADLYTEGYFERGEGSNYYNYGDDSGWNATCTALHGLMTNGKLPYPVEDEAEPKLLELGSAKGYFLKEASLWGFNPYGLDISHYAVSQTPSHIAYMNRVYDATTQLPFPAGFFHVVCSWEFLEHIETEKIPFLLDEMDRVLAPGGFFIHRIALTDGSMEPDHDVTHVSMFPRIFWEEEFIKLDLTHLPTWEHEFAQEFKHRDWSQRFFCWYKEPTVP